MKKTLVTLSIIALAPVLAAPAAEAGISSVGVAFNVGGLFFDLGFGGLRHSAHAGHSEMPTSEHELADPHAEHGAQEPTVSRGAIVGMTVLTFVLFGVGLAISAFLGGLIPMSGM